MIKSPTLRRWFDICMLAAVGAILFEAILPEAASTFIRWRSPLLYSPWFAWVLAWLTTIVAIFVLSEPLRLHWTQRTTFVRYPPLWLAVLGAVVVATLVEKLLYETHLPRHGPIETPSSVAALAHRLVDWEHRDLLGALASACLIGLGIRLWATRSDTERTSASKTPFSAKNWTDIAEWIQSESPSSDDVFEHRLVSERITFALTNARPSKGIALLGPYGSGKTTILGWVRDGLRAQAAHRQVIVDVNCWGLRRPADAPKLALRNIISALGEYVDVQAYRGLPESYQRLVAVEPSGNLEKILGNVGDGDPADALRRLQPLLDATGLRVTLIIEDADRAGAGFDSRHLERLLWTLRSIRGFAFILSNDSTKTRIDFQKLCDAIESVPALVPERVAAVVGVATDHWQKDFSFTNPALDGDADRDLLQLGHFSNPMLAYSSDLSQNTVVHALVALLRTPRNLKHFLRRVDSAWNQLFGEVDLEDLIILQALRAGAPDVFSFLLENIDPARHKPEDLSPRTKTVRRDWDRLLRKHPQADAVRILVDRLGIQQLSRSVADERKKPQGIQFFRDETDYFRRALSEQLAPNEVRDQAVIADIAEWKTSTSHRMIDVLLHPPKDNDQYLQAWSAFAFRLTDADLQKIGETVINAILKESGADADMSEHEGVLAIWRRFNRQAEYNSYESWLLIQICKAVPVSLNFANDLFSYFTYRESRLSAEAAGRVRRSFVGEVKARLSNPELLIRTLSQKHPATLNALILGPHREHFEEISQWQFLAPAIVDAALQNPTLLAPQLAILLSESSQHIDDVGKPRIIETVTLNEQRLDALFGTRRIEVLRILANATDEHSYVVAIAKAAKNLLASKQSK